MRIENFFIGLVFILAGVIAFLINLGYSSWIFLVQIKKLWPIILIIIGLGFFWKGRIPAWLAVILVLVLVGGVVFLFLNPSRLVFDRILQMFNTGGFA